MMATYNFPHLKMELIIRTTSFQIKRAL